MKQEKDETRKQELAQMAENFAHAPYEPCTHFYEHCNVCGLCSSVLNW